MYRFTFDTPKNQISIGGVSFDGSGNLIQDGVYAYKYDAENRVVDYGNGGATYAYDGNGLRVQRSYGGTTVYVFSGAKVIAEYAAGAAANAPIREYIYAGGRVAQSNVLVRSWF